MQELLNDVVVPALGIGALYGLVGISFNLIFAPGAKEGGSLGPL